MKLVFPKSGFLAGVLLLLISVGAIASPSITTAGYYPRVVELGQTQQLRLRWQNAHKCYNDKYGVVYHQASTGKNTNGEFIWDSPARNKVESKSFNIICEDTQGNKVSRYVSMQVINPKPVIVSAYYSPSRVSVGQRQSLIIQYKNASKCYNTKYGVTYYNGAQRDGTYRWTSPVRDKELTYNFAIYCENSSGQRVSKSVSAQVYNAAPRVSAGADIHVMSGPQVINLRGSASDPTANGGIKSYSWSQDSGSTILNWRNKRTAASNFDLPAQNHGDQRLKLSLRAYDLHNKAGLDSVYVYVNGRSSINIASPAAGKLPYSKPINVHLNNFSDISDGLKQLKINVQKKQGSSWSTVFQQNFAPSTSNSGKFSFSAQQKNLLPGTQYRLVAYAIDDGGSSGVGKPSFHNFTINHKPELILNKASINLVNTRQLVLNEDIVSISDADVQSHSWRINEDHRFSVQGNTLRFNEGVSGAIPVSLSVYDGIEQSTAKTLTVNLSVVDAPAILEHKFVSESGAVNQAVVGERQTLTFVWRGAEQCIAEFSYDDGRTGSVTYSKHDERTIHQSDGSYLFSWQSPVRESEFTMEQTISCSNDAGTKTSSLVNKVIPRAPQILQHRFVSASGSTNAAFIGENQVFYLAWTGSESCTSNYTYSHGESGTVTYSASDERTIVRSDGSYLFTWTSPVREAAYSMEQTINCENSGGSDSSSLVNVITPPPPQILQHEYISESEAINTARIGEKQWLYFAWKNASSCTSTFEYDDGVSGSVTYSREDEHTTVQNDGSYLYKWLSPVRDKAYIMTQTITCTNNEGSANSTLTNTVDGVVAPPKLAPQSGEVPFGESIRITHGLPSVNISFAQIAADTLCDSTADWQPYTSPIAITESTTLCAKASLDGVGESDVISADFSIQDDSNFSALLGDPDDQPFSDVQEITAEAVGTIAGQAAVNGGAASYTIPIKLPPGRAGMQPNVSLKYSSRSGNGIAGVGWGLSAGSSITRCAATVAQDGINHTPNYTANDKLCLDGQRLVIVSGNYGNSGAIYKTELDTFVRVKQTGSLTDEASFVAEYKSGRTAYFGQETSSKVIHANKSSAYSWLISYEHDATENNYIHYEYSSYGQGEQLLNTIYYTGTGAEELGDRKVVFEYESAANLYKRYIAGGYYFSTKRLKSISTEYGDAQVSSWSLSYSASLGTSRSLLDSIEYCSHISGTEKCLPSTEFDWSSKPAVYKPELLATSDGTEIFGQGHFPEGFAEVTAFGDADGNGSRDWPRYFTNAEFDQVGVNPLRGTDCHFSSMLLSTTCLQGDFNNDGRTDRWSKENNILRIGYVSGDDTISLNWQDTGVELGHYTSANRSEGDTLLSAADYNGDGWVDITVLRRISEEKRTLTVYKHTQNLQNPYTENESHELDSAIFNGYSIEPVGDMNGDGIPDFLKKKTRSVYMDSASSELLLTSTAANGAIQLQSYDVLFGADINGQSSAYGYWVDVNADGLPDWLGWVDGKVGANLTVKLNQGNGTFTEAQDIGVSVPVRRIPLHNSGDRLSEGVLRPKFSDAFRIMDIDGDGRSEVIMPNNILVEGCIILVGRRQVAQRHGRYTVCGDSVYEPYISEEGSNKFEAVEAKFDYSLYQYQALKFSQDATGSVSAHFVDTDLVGTPSYSSVMDATGNGLPDLVYKYGCRHYASGEYENHKFFCYMKGVNGERIEGPELVDKNLITYSYPSGTAGGSSAVADHQVRKVYFNRNYGATEQASIEKSDYHPHDLLLSVTNGLDKKEQWHYRPLSSDVVDGLYNNPKHNELNDTEHFYFSSSMYVVHKFTQSDGIGGNQHYTYQYRDAMFNNQGRGFMGFKSVIEKDLDRGLVTQTDFKQVFPLQGKPYRQATFLENDYMAGSLGGKSDHTNAISYTQFEWLVNTDNGNHVFLANKETITRDITQDATKLGSVVESIASIDAYGNVLESKKTSKDETGVVTVTTTRAYTPNTDTWWLNKLDTLKVETSEISERAVTDPYISLSDEQKKELDTKTTLTTNYSEYDDNSRKPKKITVSGSSGTGSSTNIVYNSYGLPTSKTVSANVLAEGTWSSSQRVVESITYTKDGTTEADDGYFPLKITNAKQHELYKHTDPATGFVTKTKVQLGDNVYQETINTLDGYQRPYSSKTSGQPKVYTVVTGPDTTHAPENAVVQITTLSAGKPTQKVYQDKLGRTLRVATQGFNSDDWVFTDTQYDALGRKVFESQPYYNGHSKYGVSYSEFDALGRPKSKVTQRSCGGMTTSYAYAGLTTDIKVKDECNSKLITMSRTYNTRDQLIETKDTEDGITRYAYNGQGLPIVIQDAKNNHITAKYNAFGRKTDVDDPNQGKSTFAYNGFGELQKETHSTDTSIIYTVDKLGRVIQRSATGEDTLTYTYDTADNGVGQLHKEVGNGVNRTYEYDVYGRPTGTLINGNNRSYRITTFYDGNYGRAKGLRYPNGLTLEYLYTDAGYLETIQNAASHYIFKKITGQDAFANVTEATLGNELTEITSYSAVDGAMTSKQIADGNNNLMFLNYEQYDGFGNIRKMDVTTGAVGEQHTFTETYTYDDLHRLKTNQVNGIKIGSYTYDAIGNLLSKSDYSNEYDYASEGSGGPNAVKRVQRNGKWVSFSYDKRGNMLTGDGLSSATYNAMDKPTTLVKNGITSQFVYGPNHMRFKHTTNGRTTYYADKLYEEEVQAEETTWRAYIDNVAIVSQTNEQAVQIRYTHTDRLGSSRLFTNHNGDVLATRNYDPFGKPRLANGNSKPSARLGDIVDTTTYRGFTDHEHLDEHQLIHMNGRVYDYNLGRFMSVDPVIQSPGNSQSINPYSYIMNNPLAGTDPSGYNSLCLKGESRVGCGGVGGLSKGEINRSHQFSGGLNEAMSELGFSGNPATTFIENSNGAFQAQQKGHVAITDINAEGQKGKADGGHSGGGGCGGIFAASAAVCAVLPPPPVAGMADVTGQGKRNRQMADSLTKLLNDSFEQKKLVVKVVQMALLELRRPNTEALKKTLAKAGMEKPEGNWDAHHIVFWGHSHADSKLARDLLEEFEIDINSADNLVWLPRTVNDKIQLGVTHIAHHGDGVHTHRAISSVYQRLNMGVDSNHARAILRSIRNDLERGHKFWETP
ncbi:SpvB/TcaC N-terminal domain-containing protein [Pseudoalteromonas sp. Cnat2-41]|uniref:SpvB/TcaC N-terminal domain-containing protein n=1 Tax=unclassified Pseudoalteromonas TaxID=194690 RepID=UPI001EF7DB0E|nr:MULTISPECIES: SpvB/TcaC N-terminal domain-containing protein [unclassified Pseudoalteromonas]MCF2860882.1 FG-GAP-like repeat-containing protein [Pseudoalteromonas sp. CNAT2-18]MCG7556751.1 FG-GAP-like repeat-containing protein [Pseudoalteromonas sp. CNAT2-18.1]